MSQAPKRSGSACSASWTASSASSSSAKGIMVWGERASLLAVEDLPASVPVNGVAHRIESAVSRQGIGKRPGERPPRGPVDRDEQIGGAAAHRNAGDVHRPHRIAPLDGKVAQENRMDVTTPLPPGCVGLPLGRCDAHARHPCADVPAAGLERVGMRHRQVRISARAMGRVIIEKKPEPRAPSVAAASP